jgi:hypothetical protein
MGEDFPNTPLVPSIVPLPIPGATPRLAVLELDDLLERVEEVGATGWLVEQLWPRDAYGVRGAEDKAGKTWDAVDFGISVRSGSPYLGRFPCPNPGNVLMFWGEGGERAMLRRYVAVAESKGLHLADLMPGFRSCFRVPKLKRPDDLEEVRQEVEKNEPALVIVDPLYLAASGARGADLYDMGDALGGIQEICQDAGAALEVTTHWNKTGEGKGANRFSGVGPGAWGRVLGSAAVEHKTTDPESKESTVILRWEYTGGEIADTAFIVRRRVWVDDPANLSSPMHYEVEVTEDAPVTQAGQRVGTTKRRLLAALEGTDPEHRSTTPDIAAVVDEDGGKRYGERTYQKALAELEELGLVKSIDHGPGLPREWWRT